MTKLVGVMLDGVRTIHAPSHGYGVYDTLCGIDADDPTIGHEGQFDPHPNEFITCAACYSIWRGVIAMGLREKDFRPRIRK
jgi:hypothetical protein